MKKLSLALLIICLLLTANTSYATEPLDSRILLSEMTEEECLAFIEAQGLTIPEELADYEKLGEFVKETIATVENNPDCIFFYNYSVTLDFANQIKVIVNAYYGNAVTRSLSDDPLLDFYDLQDSETVGVWGYEFEHYNCYAYALGYNSSPTGDRFFPHPGSFTDPEQFDLSDPIENWAGLTVLDLAEEGYSCVVKTDAYSEAMALSASHIIICLRKGDHPDFHFMRYEVNSWYHKPGASHLLRYLYYRPDIKNWTNEGSSNGIDYPGTEGKSYSGTIYYFAIDFDHHDCTWEYTGNHYHFGNEHFFEVRTTCGVCGDVVISWASQPCSGPPCSVNILSAPMDDLVE